MSCATALIEVAPVRHAKNDPQSVWNAMVNAVSTWKEVDPALFRGIDFEPLIAAAEYHGVLPIVAKRVLESAATRELKPAIKDRLRRVFQANLVRGVPLINEVLRVLNEFESSGIPIIPYKGPVLAGNLWGNSTLRECADLDFLIQRENVERAGKILDRLGYARVSPIADYLRPALLKNASEEQFQHRENRLLLELQWAPAPRVLSVRCDVKAMWLRTRRISFSRESALSPADEDLLMFLSIHGWKHNWGRLIWLGDVAQLIRTSNINWDRLFSEGARNRNVRMLALGLRMANRIFDVALPRQFNFCDPALEVLVDELVGRMRDISPCGYRDWHRCMLSARDTQFDRARQMATFLFTPGLGEYAACKLPKCVASGYRMIRFARLLRLSSQKRVE
jgi:hypothetical protein